VSHKREITQIEPQQRNKQRRSIYLEGEFAFGLDEELVLKFGLHEGDLIDESELLAIIQAEEKKGAKDTAVRFLSYRSRSEKEVRDKLFSKGFSEDTVESVLAELKQARLVDDVQFAMAFVHDKMILNPMGPLLIHRDLKQAGLADSVIELAVEEAFREKTMFEIALELAQKKIRQLQSPDGLKTKKRLTDFLYRRGFDWDITREVLEQLEIETPNVE
jgi:regulatory protein